MMMMMIMIIIVFLLSLDSYWSNVGTLRAGSISQFNLCWNSNLHKVIGKFLGNHE